MSHHLHKERLQCDHLDKDSFTVTVEDSKCSKRGKDRQKMNLLKTYADNVLMVINEAYSFPTDGFVQGFCGNTEITHRHSFIGQKTRHIQICLCI